MLSVLSNAHIWKGRGTFVTILEEYSGLSIVRLLMATTKAADEFKLMTKYGIFQQYGWPFASHNWNVVK